MASLSCIITCGALNPNNPSAAVLVSRVSLHFFHGITSVSLLDPAVKLLQAGAQRGMALRDEDLLLLLAAASIPNTLVTL